MSNLKNGLKVTTLISLISLISACASKPVYITNVVTPKLFANEGNLLPYPVMPEKSQRTNGNMYLYRLQVEQWGCDTAHLFNQFVQRITESKQKINVPPERCETVKEELSQILSESIKKT